MADSSAAAATPNAPALIDALNELRAFALGAWLQASHHGRMAVTLAMPSVRTLLGYCAAAHLDHADRLADRVHQLGGVPIYHPREVADLLAMERADVREAPTMPGMVQEDLVMARRQISMLQPMIRLIGFQDTTTRPLLEDVLKDNERIASELQRLLYRVTGGKGPVRGRVLPLRTSYDLKKALAEAIGRHPSSQDPMAG
jgi:bacterioferritin